MSKKFRSIIWLSIFVLVSLSAVTWVSADMVFPSQERVAAPVQDRVAVPVRPPEIVPTLVPVPVYTPKNSDAVLIVAGVAAVSGAALAMFILHQSPR